MFRQNRALLSRIFSLSLAVFLLSDVMHFGGTPLQKYSQEWGFRELPKIFVQPRMKDDLNRIHHSISGLHIQSAPGIAFLFSKYPFHDS